jgi:predicted permease
MRDPLWRLCEWRLRGSVPAANAVSTIGDLAEDYARVRTVRGKVRAWCWLARETASLARAYRAERSSGTPRRRLALAADLRYAVRRTAAAPATALLCALLLSAGIGLATAMFGVVDSLLLRPAPFAGGDRLVEQGFFRPEPAVMDAWRDSGLFEAVEAGRVASFDDEETGRVWAGAFVTPGVFDMLGVRPLYGGVFLPDDARTGSRDVVIVSETIWRSAFGADPALVGRRLTIDGAVATVVGIMPAAFRFPEPATVAWKPFVPSPVESGPATIFGRVKPGVPRAEVEARTAVIAKQAARLPARYRGTPPLHALGGRDPGAFIRRALWLLLGGVALVFAVLCSNVSGLLIARLFARRREFALCAALGASRARLMRQAAAEHAIIAATGTALGVALAAGLVPAVPEYFLGRTLNPIDVDRRAVAAASILGAAAVFVAGLLPAWLGTRGDPAGAIRGSTHVGTESRAARAGSRALLVAQIALACSLLVGSALLARSFSNLVHADRGLRADGIVRVDLSGLDRAFPTPDAMGLGTDAIEAAAAAWPEIGAVALSREIPPNVRAVGLADSDVRADQYRVNAGFFALYGIPILRGRTFAPNDTEQEAIVGDRLAGLLWPDADPVGQRVVIGNTARRVIGVAGEIILPTVASELDRPEYYTPLGNASRTLFLNLRCRGACPDERAIRSRLAAVHPSIGARLVPSAEIEYLNHLRLPRAVAEVGGVFAIVAVLTAAGGLFSVMTLAVGRRRREFGVRVALGASPAQLRRLVLRDVLGIVMTGGAVGAAGGWVVARGLASFHYGVSADDPVSWLGVLGTIAIAALAAAWRPILQAVRVDPVTLLREE